FAFDQTGQIRRIRRRGNNRQIFEPFDLRSLRVLVGKSKGTDNFVHPVPLGPLLDKLEQGMRNAGVVDAIQLKKTRRLFVILVVVLAVYNPHYASNELPVQAGQDTDYIGMRQGRVMP